MKKSRVGLLVAAALGILPATSWAQGKGAKGAAASGEAAGTAEASAEAAPAGEAAASGEATPAADEGELPQEGGGLEEICKIDPAACPNLDMEKEAARPLRESIKHAQFSAEWVEQGD